MKIVIEGAGEVGTHLAKMLRAEANDVTVLDNDASRLEALSSSVDVETIEGAASSIKSLKAAGVEKADLFIAVYPFSTQEVNIVSAILAKKLGAAKVVARVNDEEYLTPENKLLFKELGIELMFYPEKNAADEIVDQLKHTASSGAMDFARGKLQIAAFKLDENAQILDYKISDFAGLLKAEEKDQFRIIAIGRDDKTIIPTADTKFLFGDLVFTISRKEGIQSLAGYFGKSNIEVRSVMIFGGGAIAEMVAVALVKIGITVKIIEKDRDKCIALTEKLPKDVLIVNGDGRNSDFLYEERISDCDAFLALTGSDETNVLACVLAKKFGVPRTIAEVENIEYLHLAEGMGVDSVINKKMIMAGRIFKFTLSGKARFVKYMGGTDAEVMEYTVAPGSAITKGQLKDINFPSTAIVGGVIRGNDAIIAVGSTRIEAYDRVAVFALPQSIKEISKFFE